MREFELSPPGHALAYRNPQESTTQVFLIFFYSGERGESLISRGVVRKKKDIRFLFSRRVVVTEVRIDAL